MSLTQLKLFWAGVCMHRCIAGCAHQFCCQCMTCCGKCVTSQAGSPPFRSNSCGWSISGDTLFVCATVAMLLCGSHHQRSHLHTARTALPWLGIVIIISVYVIFLQVEQQLAHNKIAAAISDTLPGRLDSQTSVLAMADGSISASSIPCHLY